MNRQLSSRTDSTLRKVGCRKNNECQKYINNSICVNTKCICDQMHKLVENKNCERSKYNSKRII